MGCWVSSDVVGSGSTVVRGITSVDSAPVASSDAMLEYEDVIDSVGLDVPAAEGCTPGA